MKKILSLALVLAMVFTMSVTAFAAEITDGSGSVDITYTYEAPADSYIVTIPDSMAIGTDATVSAADVVITAGYLLTVSVSSEQYNEGWKLVNSNDPVGYTLKIDGADIENNGTVLTAKNGDTEVTKTLVTALVDTPKYSGNYTDTLTFHVSVAECEHSYNSGICIHCGWYTVLDLSQYSAGATVDITENCQIIGDGTEFNVTLNIAADATVIFEVGTSGVKLGGSINVADGKTLTLLVKGNAEHTVKDGISLGNSANVIIEGDLTQENNKLTVTSSGGNAGIGANGGVTAGDITIRNARVDATGSTSDSSQYYMSGAGIGTANASMGNILIENSIVTAAGGYYFSSSSSDPTSHAAAIGMGSSCVTMGNITLIDSEITASNNGDGHASVIGAGSFYHPTATNDNIETVGNMGNIIITSTELNLSMAKGSNWFYAAMIGPGLGNSAYSCVNMGKIIFTDVTQAELDEMIATWSIPSDFNQYGAYVLGRGRDGSYYDTGDFDGVWVSDGNGDTVQIGDESGYYDPE